MVRKHRDPLQSLLLSRVSVYIRQIEVMVKYLGSADWEKWQLVFDSLDSLKDYEKLNSFLKELLKAANSIYDLNEKTFVLSTILKTYVVKGNIFSLKEFLLLVDDLLNLIFQDINSLESASALAKIWYAAHKFGEKDLMDEVEGIVKSLIKRKRIRGDWLAEYYSEMGSSLASEDIDLSEKYFMDAIMYAKSLDKKKRINSLARVALRYKYVTHSKEMERDLNNIVEDIIEKFDFNNSEDLKHFLEISIYLHKINPDPVEDILKRLFYRLLSIKEIEKKIVLSHLYLRVLDFLGLDDLKARFLKAISGSVDLLDNDGLYGVFASSALVRYADLSIGFRYDLLESTLRDFRESFDIYSHEKFLEITNIIVRNLVNVDFEKVALRLRELLEEKVSTRDMGEIRKTLYFTKAIKSIAPKLAKEIAYKISEIILDYIRNGFDIETRILKILAEISEDAFNNILNSVIEDFEIREDCERTEILTKIVPLTIMVDEIKFNYLIDEIQREIVKLPLLRRIEFKKKMAESLSLVDKDEAKNWYRLAIRECEILRKKNVGRALREISRIIKSIEEFLGDVVWAKHLRSYYFSLDIFLD